MKRFAGGVLVGLVLMALLSAPWVYAVGSCSVYRSWNTGDSVTAADLNSSFTQAAVTNSTPQCLDDYSASTGQMQSQVDPYPSATESLATSTAGELERLRYVIGRAFGWTFWYRYDQGINFASVGSQHLSATALHLGAGSARFPSLTSITDHQSGFFFPLAGHIALAIRDGNLNGGSQGGIEVARWHAQGLTLHHTAAIRFAHSQAGMDGGQRTHVTALRIDPTTDQIVIGHSGSAIRLEGAGLTAGASQFLTLNTGNVLTTSSATNKGGPRVIGQFSGNGFNANQGHIFTLRAHAVVFMNAANHALSVVWNPTSPTVNIGTSGPTAGGRDRAATPNINPGHWQHVYWVYDDSTVSGVISPDGPAIGPNLPSGYSSWAYCCAVRIQNVSANPIVGVHVMGALSVFTNVEGQNALNAGTATTVTVVDLSTLIPEHASVVSLAARCETVGGSTASDRCRIRSVSSLDFLTMGQPVAAGAPDSASLMLPVLSQRFYYIITTAGTPPSLTLHVAGWMNPAVGGN